jgi:hypothetical protein
MAKILQCSEEELWAFRKEAPSLRRARVDGTYWTFPTQSGTWKITLEATPTAEDLDALRDFVGIATQPRGIRIVPGPGWTLSQVSDIAYRPIMDGPTGGTSHD